MIIVKFGGSVITNKQRLRSFRRAACDRLCKELKSYKGRMVLVHGAGSFGHIIASQAELHKGVKKDDLEKLHQVAIVHKDVRDLDARVLHSMSRAKLKGFSVPPYTAASFSDRKMTDFSPEEFERLLESRMVPVTFGDVVPDKKLRFSICSGDLMMLALAKHFKPEMVVFVADVDGVYSSDPKLDEDAELYDVLTFDDIANISAGTGRNDVTGAMRGKLSRMLEISEHCENTIILNGNVSGRLENAIKGNKVISTKVVA